MFGLLELMPRIPHRQVHFTGPSAQNINYDVNVQLYAVCGMLLFKLFLLLSLLLLLFSNIILAQLLSQIYLRELLDQLVVGVWLESTLHSNFGAIVIWLFYCKP